MLSWLYGDLRLAENKCVLEGFCLLLLWASEQGVGVPVGEMVGWVLTSVHLACLRGQEVVKSLE